jgi:hypothetical protein
MAALRYVFDAVREIKRALKGRVPLIGFAGSPFTLACYMIEGAGSPDFASVRRMAHGRPDLLQRLVAVNARAVAAYLNEQILAGADAVMIFDTWGGLLTTDAYHAFSLDSMRAVLAAMRPGPDGREIPAIVFTKGGDNGSIPLPMRRCVRRTRLDRRSPLPAGAWATALRCRAISIRWCCSRMRKRRPRGDRGRSRGGRGPGPHFQSGAWHRSGDASRQRRGPGRDGAPRIARRPRGDKESSEQAGVRRDRFLRI